jgi:hypothetical protein
MDVMDLATAIQIVRDDAENIDVPTAPLIREIQETLTVAEIQSWKLAKRIEDAYLNVLVADADEAADVLAA